MSVFSKVLELLFPPRCVFCRRILTSSTQGCCNDCLERLPIKSRPRQGSWFLACYSPLSYEGEVQQALLRFKFRDRPGYAAAFGRLLADCIRENLQGQYDLITWIPVSEERRKQRGYDQAMLLALAAALELEDVAVETLRKQKHNSAQSTLHSAEERRRNVQGAYEAADPDLIAGKRILLIDDIITTGATMDEASHTLLTAGAETVVCATVAHTPEEQKTEEESL